MIKLISELPWTPYGIQCTDSVTAHYIHKFLREAVLDRHIYTTKIAGFTIETNNTFRASTGDYITRHEQIGESYPELMVKLQDKLFLNAGKAQLDIMLETGMNTVNNIKIDDCGSNRTIEILYVKPDICRCLKKETILRISLLYDCGYKHMSETCKGLDSSFFPCNIDFGLSAFYRILPMQPDDTLVPIRYYNGATEAQFKDILKKWMIYCNTGNIKEEEKLWLQSFEH